jgi:polysaccharide biosynthesis/export protein
MNDLQNTTRSTMGMPTRLRSVARTMMCLVALGFASTHLSAATPPSRPLAADGKIQAPPARPTTTAATRPLVPLGSGDVVNIQVFGRPELNTTTSVAEDGTVEVPLAGTITVAGLSPSSAAQKIAAAYRTGQFLRNPQVTVLLTQPRSQLVSVLGEVKTPGRFPVESRSTVIDLLAQAGGTTERSGNVLYLMRANEAGDMERHTLDLRGLQDQRYSLKVLTLQGGDSVFVPPAEQFYIYGEVQQPNMYRLEPNMTVLQAISRSGGLTKVASSSRIEIKRRDQSGLTLTRKATLDEKVQADDVIYVKEGFF